MIIRNNQDLLRGKLANATIILLSVIPFLIIILLFLFITGIGFCDILGIELMGDISIDTTKKVLFYFFLLFALTDFLSLLFYSNILPLVKHDKPLMDGYLESVLLLGLIIILYEAFQKYIGSTDTNVAFVLISLGILLVAITIYSQYRYRKR